MPDAASHAGALGLMQVMPGTARYLAKKKVKRNSLFNPNRNVELGTQYMRYLMDKMDNIPYKETRNYVMAVLAYQQIYSQHLGGSKNLFKELATMQIQPKS